MPNTKALVGLLSLIGALIFATRPPVAEVVDPTAEATPLTATVVEPLPPNFIDRLSALHPGLHRRLLFYRADEGDRHRGQRFFQLTAALDRTRANISYRPGEKPQFNPSSNATTIEIFSFLGLPERGIINGRDSLFIYPFNTDSKFPEIAIVSIANGVLESVGYNDPSAIDEVPGFQAYQKWSDLLVERDPAVSN